MDIYSEAIKLFSASSILGKVTIVSVILAIIFLIAYFLWYFILILYYKYID